MVEGLRGIEARLAGHGEGETTTEIVRMQRPPFRPATSPIPSVPHSAEPSGALTLIGPVTAPEGTVVVRLVPVAAVTVAVAPPLKVTVFWPGVGLKPFPKIWTVVPTLPVLGVTRLMETAALGSTVNRCI